LGGIPDEIPNSVKSAKEVTPRENGKEKQMGKTEGRENLKQKGKREEFPKAIRHPGKSRGNSPLKRVVRPGRRR